MKRNVKTNKNLSMGWVFIEIVLSYFIGNPVLLGGINRMVKVGEAVFQEKMH